MMIAIAAQKCCQRQPLTIDVYCSENIVIKQVAFMTFLLFSGRGRVSVEGNPYPQQSGAKCELRPSTGTFARRFRMAGGSTYSVSNALRVQRGDRASFASSAAAASRDPRQRQEWQHDRVGRFESSDTPAACGRWVDSRW